MRVLVNQFLDTLIIPYGRFFYKRLTAEFYRFFGGGGPKSERRYLLENHSFAARFAKYVLSGFSFSVKCGILGKNREGAKYNAF